MTTDDLRTRAREAAEGYCGNSIEAEVFVDGALWHAAQQPSRDIDVDELARVADAVFHEWWNDPDEPRFGPLYARAVLALLTGDESDE